MASQDQDLTRLFVRDLDDIRLPPRDKWRPTPRKESQLMKTSRYVLYVGAIAAVLVIALVASFQLRDSNQVAASPSPTPAREPSTLVQLSWERAVIDAFRAGGLSVRTVGGSKNEAALGVLLPARAFIVSSGAASGGFGTGADVIYVKGASLGAISVCEVAPSAPGRHGYVISVGGRRVGSEDAVAPVFHLVSSDYYIIAYDTATRDALQRGLGLAQATCL